MPNRMFAGQSYGLSRQYDTTHLQILSVMLGILHFRYRKEDSPVFFYVDVPLGITTFEVQDLKVGTRYSFAVKAINAIGESEYTPDIEEVETKSE